MSDYKKYGRAGGVINASDGVQRPMTPEETAAMVKMYDEHLKNSFMARRNDDGVALVSAAHPPAPRRTLWQFIVSLFRRPKLNEESLEDIEIEIKPWPESGFGSASVKHEGARLCPICYSAITHCNCGRYPREPMP